MQVQIERLVGKKKGFFKWKKFGLPSLIKGVDVIQKIEEVDEDSGLGRETPLDIKTKLMRGKTPPPKWRKSMS